MIILLNIIYFILEILTHYLLMPFAYLSVKVFELEDKIQNKFWHPQQGSNLHLILRRNLFYPVELWGRNRGILEQKKKMCNIFIKGVDKIIY